MEESEQSSHYHDDCVMVRTFDGNIQDWSRGAARLYGWRREEAVGRISHELLRTSFPKPLEEIESELLHNKLWEGELVHATRDDHRVVVKSRWVLDPTKQAGAVVETNTFVSDCTAVLKTERSTNSAQIADKDFSSAIKSKEAERQLNKVANVILASAGLASILVLIYYLYWYQWSAVRQFNSSFGMVYSYGVPAVLGIAFLTLLKARATLKTNLTILCVSLLVSLYAGEIISRLSSPTVISLAMGRVMGAKDKHQEAAKVAKQDRVAIDVRSVAEVVADFGKKGIDAIPIMTLTNNFLVTEADGSVRSALKVDGREILPLATVANRLTVMCNESGQYVSYESDEHGFSNPRGIWGSGKLDVDVVALGDSFAHGYCVSPGDSFVGLIRRKFNATLNLGIAGLDPLLELAVWKEYGQFFKPKTVLWFYFEGNDLEGLQVNKTHPILLNYLKDGFTQSLISRQEAIDRTMINDIPRQIAINQEREERRKSNESKILPDLVDFAKLGNLRNRLGLVAGSVKAEEDKLSDLRGPTIDLFSKIAAQIQQKVADRGGKLYFVYLPDWPRYSSRATLRTGMKQRERVLSVVKNLGIPIIDIVAAFQAHGDPLLLFPFREPGHYNEAGHRIVAEEVLRTLNSGK